MLSKELRLDKKEIPEIAKRGKRLDSELFFIKAWYDETLPNSQFAISISIKIDKRAAVRNRIKRKLRAVIMDLVSEDFNFRKGKYLIIVKSKELVDVKNEKILEDFKSIL